MEKYLETLCKQNPILEYECDGCNAINQIPMRDFLEKKYEYVMTCKNCGKTTTINTLSFHKEAKKLKPYLS